jgi:predicted GNAT family acetyltransferase
VSEPISVRHDVQRHRFIADVAGGQAGLFYTGPRDGVVTFTHTEVPESAQGRGVGATLARTGLDWAREHGLRVRPLCPYVAAYVRRHPVYGALIVVSQHQ